MERLKEDRNYILVILIGLIPFGWIYRLVFMNDAILSLNAACGRKEQDSSRRSVDFFIFFILTIVTLGIYEIYWIHQQGKRMSDAGEAYGITNQFLDPQRKGFTFIIAAILMPVIGLILLIIPLLGIVLYVCLVITAIILSMLGYNKFFNDLNILCRAYNREMEGIINGHDQPPVTPVRQVSDRPALSSPASPVLTAPPSPALLPGTEGGVMMVSGQYAGSKISLKQGENIVIGRDPARCALICDSEKVSRVHVSIQYVNGSYMVTDMSTNGTISSESGSLPRNQQIRQKSGTTLQLAQSGESVRLM